MAPALDATYEPITVGTVRRSCVATNWPSSGYWSERSSDHWLGYYCAGGEGTVPEDAADALGQLVWTPRA